MSPWGRSFKRPLEHTFTEQLADCAAEKRHLERIPVWLARTEEWQPDRIELEKYARENRN